MLLSLLYFWWDNSVHVALAGVYMCKKVCTLLDIWYFGIFEMCMHYCEHSFLLTLIQTRKRLTFFLHNWFSFCILLITFVWFSSVPKEYKKSCRLWVVEAVSLLLCGGHRQVYHLHHWYRDHLSEWVSGVHRETGHHPTHWQVRGLASVLLRVLPLSMDSLHSEQSSLTILHLIKLCTHKGIWSFFSVDVWILLDFTNGYQFQTTLSFIESHRCALKGGPSLGMKSFPDKLLNSALCMKFECNSLIRIISKKHNVAMDDFVRMLICLSLH